MAQLIATIALSICIILLQHLYNYIARKLWQHSEEASIPPLFGMTALNIALSVLLFNLIIFINK
jgi:F0F1-type ATP synthase membrane subunit a